MYCCSDGLKSYQEIWANVFWKFAESCDVKRFLHDLELFEKQAEENYLLVNLYKIARSVGLIYCGTKAAALELLDTVDEKALSDFDPNSPDFGIQVNMYTHYLYSYTMAYRILGEFDQAQKMIHKMNALFSNRSIAYEQLQQIKLMAVMQQYFLFASKGMLEGTEEFFRVQLFMAITNLERVQNHYFLGYILMQKGKNQEASEAFRFVIEHGGNLEYVTYAKRHLEQMNA